jgi:predicted dehydrogenase
MKKITVGLLGSGFAGRIHADAYRRVYGLSIDLKAVATLAPDADAFARAYGIRDVYTDYRELLKDPEIDVVDIVLPPALHTRCAMEAARAGKHVLCEKPMGGYYGRPGDAAPIGLHVPRARMLEAGQDECAQMERDCAETGRYYGYCENWIYTPAVQKMAELLRAKGSRQLASQSECSHAGSHAASAAEWAQSGGGNLFRQACHCLSTVLYLKEIEAQKRGEAIRPASVLCDTARVCQALAGDAHRYVESHPVDVEDWASLSLAFSDGTRALIVTGDMVLGGTRNHLRLYTNDGVLEANLSPNNALNTYFADADGLGDVYFTEKLQTKAGWQQLYLLEAHMRGYCAEIQSFMACIAQGSAPESGLRLAMDTEKILYAAYLSAETGHRQDLTALV